MKYCIVDGLKLEDKQLCVAEDNTYLEADCDVLTSLKIECKNHNDCPYYKRQSYSEMNDEQEKFINNITIKQLQNLTYKQAKLLKEFLKGIK